MRDTLTITGLYASLLKSGEMRQVPLDARLDLDDYGAVGDRRLMAVDDDGKFISQRGCPQLALVSAHGDSDSGVLFHAPNVQGKYIKLQWDEAAKREVKIHGTTTTGFDQGAIIAWWLSQESVLGVRCRLVALPPDHDRLVDQEFAGNSGALVGYADGWPLLGVNDASLAALQDALPELTPVHFRPNFTFSGLPPWGEDDLIGQRLQVVGRDLVLIFDNPCARCKVTQVDPQTGKGDALPTLQVLKAHGRHQVDAAGERGLRFGVNVRYEIKNWSDAYLQVGDELVLADE